MRDTSPMNTIALDIGSEVSAFCAVRQGGSVLLEQLVSTRIPALRAALRQVPSPKKLVFEECPQAAWLYAELRQEVDDILICDPRKVKRLSDGKKNDRNDARSLAELARIGVLSRVWHGGEELQKLREAVWHYNSLTQHSTRLKNQFKAILRAKGVSGGRNPYAAQEALLKSVPSQCRHQLLALAELIEVLMKRRKVALREMVSLARRHRCYVSLRTMPAVGPIFCASLLAIVGDPERFRTRRQFWAYGGLAILTDDTGEYRFRDGKFERKRERSNTRGLTNSFNRPLKHIFKQAAMTLSRTVWKDYYEITLKNSKNRNMALLTVARRFAAIVLQIMKKREAYDVAKAPKQH